MSYQKADRILPRELLEQVQEYVDGALIYIPKTAWHKKRWGEGTSTRQELRFRNQQIYSDYLSGLFIFHLYVSTLFIKQELGWYPPVRMLQSDSPASAEPVSSIVLWIDNPYPLPVRAHAILKSKLHLSQRSLDLLTDSGRIQCADGRELKKSRTGNHIKLYIIGVLVP